MVLFLLVVQCLECSDSDTVLNTWSKKLSVFFMITLSNKTAKLLMAGGHLVLLISRIIVFVNSNLSNRINALKVLFGTDGLS